MNASWNVNLGHDIMETSWNAMSKIMNASWNVNLGYGILFRNIMEIKIMESFMESLGGYGNITETSLYDIDIGAEDCAEKAKALDKLSQIEDAENIARGAAHPEQDLVEHTYVPDPNIAFGPNTAPVPEVQPQAG
ncbi:hypothetical protein LWI29_007691 [Acer saccharum]|uniref:Uncharacterized protein n=1 Tax=Acer saccharum TaxID=4024 RepID=A0AA39SNT5_ACESA|nr:hypothetical protein LWI29_007691 [Acer saccharum]